MVCWYWNHTSCSDFLVTILKASLSFSFYFYPLAPLFYLFFKPATYKECKNSICSDQAEAGWMWPAICWMGNKRRNGAICHLLMQKAAGHALAFQQGFPRWEIEKEKHLLHFPPVLTWQLSHGKVERKRGLLANGSLSSGWSSTDKLSFALRNALTQLTLLSGIEHHHSYGENCRKANSPLPNS